MKLCYLTHDKLNPKKLVCHHMACDSVNSKNKKYHKCNDCRHDLKYEYSQLYFL